MNLNFLHDFSFFDYRLFLWTLNQSKEQKPIASLKLFYFISGSWATSAHPERRQSPGSAFYSNDKSVGRSRKLHEFPGQYNCYYLKPIFYSNDQSVGRSRELHEFPRSELILVRKNRDRPFVRITFFRNSFFPSNLVRLG